LGTAFGLVAGEFLGAETIRRQRRVRARPGTLAAVHQGGDPEIELTIVTMTFDAADPDALLGVLAKYVVLTRGHEGCRNVDLAASATRPGRYVIVQKWESPGAQQAHFDSDDMVEMATSCRGLLASPPAIDLLEPVTAHDLA
jgi:quinol monooxygenase YgiN